MENWCNNTDKEVGIVEQHSNELEASGALGMGLAIGTELVNPYRVSNRLLILQLDYNH